MIDVSESSSTPRQASRHFPFLRLPPELRQQVYRCYFDNLNDIKTDPSNRWSQYESQFLSLLRVNSQTRREACPIFYKEYIGHARSVEPHYWYFQCHDNIVAIEKLEAISGFLAEYSPDVEFGISFSYEWAQSYQILCYLSGLVKSLNPHLARSVYETSMENHMDWLLERKDTSVTGPFMQTIGRLTVACKADLYEFRGCDMCARQVTITGSFAKLDFAELESQLSQTWPFGELDEDFEFCLRRLQWWQCA